MTTAVVVGAGPNGLAAAIHLARHGVDVQVLEARDTIGGGARSGELTVPGVIHDHCSAFHPLGVGSPFWAAIDLQRYGLTWKWPDVDCAHPLDDGTAGVLYRSIEATAAGLGPDGKRWQRAVGDLAAGFDELAEDLLRPVLNMPRHPIRLARFGPRAALPATAMARRFHTERARALLARAAQRATAANGQLRERGGAGGWVGVHCPVVGGGVLVTRVRLLQLPCLCTPPACQQRLVATLAWATAVGRFRCRGRRSCGWRPLLRLGRCGAVRRGGVPFRPGWVRVPRYLVRCGLAGRRSPRATRVGDH